MSLKEFEMSPKGTELDLDLIMANLKTDKDGLIAAIAQQHDTKEVLMLAYMNENRFVNLLKQVKCAIGPVLVKRIGVKAKALATDKS